MEARTDTDVQLLLPLMEARTDTDVQLLSPLMEARSFRQHSVLLSDTVRVDISTCRAVVWNLSLSCVGESSAMNGQDLVTDLSSTLLDAPVRLRENLEIISSRRGPRCFGRCGSGTSFDEHSTFILDLSISLC